MPKQVPAMKKRAVRGSKSGRPIMALLDLLGRRWSLRIIWELRDDRSLTSRALRTACDEASPTILQTRLSELREAGPQRHRGGRENLEHQDLHLPGRMDRERQQSDQQGGEPEPEQEDTRREQLQRHQDDAEDQPVPGAKRGKHLGHGVRSLYLWSMISG